MIKRLLMAGFVFLFVLTACAEGQDQGTTLVPTISNEGTQAAETPAGTRQLRVMTHDSFAISEEVALEFEETYNVDLQILQSGDTGTALNRAILSKNNPLADVFYGVDNTYLTRALDEGIFEPYESPQLANIPEQYRLDPQNRALPVDWGDVCLNYDKRYFEENGIEPPQTLEDLLEPEYESLLVVENPASSSPGLAFLLATIGVFGEDSYLEYWEGLVENDVLVVQDWNTAYYTEFSGSSGRGPRPVVVSYGSSPAAEVIFADPPIEEPPTAAVTADNTCFRQIEFVGILSGTPNRDLAELWVDFMLSPTYQEDMPMQMFVFPVREDAELDDAFQQYMEIPENPVQLDVETISENREEWLQAWTETVLQ